MKRRRFPRRNGTIVFLLLLTVVAVRLWQRGRQPSPPEVLTEGFYEVERVVDGDTLLLTNHARVRLIGADTPETVRPGHPVEAWGPEATAFTKSFVADKKVRLEFDRERVDRYGRFLAYVWVGDSLLSEELIRRGLARAGLEYRFSPTVKRRLRNAQEEARNARLGIWSDAAR